MTSSASPKNLPTLQELNSTIPLEAYQTVVIQRDTLEQQLHTTKDRYIRFMREMEERWEDDLHFKDQYERMRRMVEEKEQAITDQTCRMAELARHSDEIERKLSKARADLETVQEERQDRELEFKRRFREAQSQHQAMIQDFGDKATRELRAKDAEVEEARRAAELAERSLAKVQAELSVERQAASEKTVRMASQMSQKEADLDDLKHQLQARSAELQQLSTRLDRASSFETQANLLTDELRRVKSASEERVERAVRDARNDLEVSHLKEVSQLKIEIAQLKHEQSTVESIISNKTLIRSIETAVGSHMQRLSDDTGSAASQLKSATDEIIKATLAGVKEREQEATTQAMYTVEAQARLQHERQVQDLREKFSEELRTAVTQAREECERRSQGREAQLSAEVKRLAEVAEAAQQRYIDATNQVHELESRLQLASQEHSRLQLELTAARADLADRQRTVGELNSKLRDAEGRLQELGAELEGKRRQLEEARARERGNG
ncbi:Chromosome partition protein Smc [Carpediemonas membranifera]|uniref:Chromosome partition protein Smc n=1 Tax=Carpediemonas membranifera TaxID=201153 RepID=A0A8J6C1F4_9EUKA|nr:Chromosome partition protein Smc [Carpediemonas membranifera]|eukprot:KAG9397521.1 Chromosome partition protein Smc [Carpediemonas membranifera]